MVQITQLPIKKSIYYEITTVFKGEEWRFPRHLFSWPQKPGLAKQNPILNSLTWRHTKNPCQD